MSPYDEDGRPDTQLGIQIHNRVTIIGPILILGTQLYNWHERHFWFYGAHRPKAQLARPKAQLDVPIVPLAGLHFGARAKNDQKCISIQKLYIWHVERYNWTCQLYLWHGWHFGS
jgi:hypothetical protein